MVALARFGHCPPQEPTILLIAAVHAPCLLRVKTGSYRSATWPSASPRLTDITDSRVLPVLPVAEPLGHYAAATLASAKGSGCTLDIVAWLTPYVRARSACVAPSAGCTDPRG